MQWLKPYTLEAKTESEVAATDINLILLPQIRIG